MNQSLKTIKNFFNDIADIIAKFRIDYKLSWNICLSSDAIPTS
jgi:hypothetical protein